MDTLKVDNGILLSWLNGNVKIQSQKATRTTVSQFSAETLTLTLTHDKNNRVPMRTNNQEQPRHVRVKTRDLKGASTKTPTFHLRLLDGFPSATAALPPVAIDLPSAAPPPFRRGDTPFPLPSLGLNRPPPPLGLALGSALGWNGWKMMTPNEVQGARGRTAWPSSCAS